MYPFFLPFFHTSNVSQAFELVVHFVICPNCLGHKLKVHTHTFHLLVIYNVSNNSRYMFAFRVAADHPGWSFSLSVVENTHSFDFHLYSCLVSL